MINPLKRLPLRFKGELHQIQLINFSVELAEINELVPAPIKAKSFDGRALISMVNVQLKKMRPNFVPEAMSFQYQHVGFRLLVEDQAYHNERDDKGIFFLDSFTQNPLMAWGGALLTEYRLHTAELWTQGPSFSLRHGAHILSYDINETQVPAQHNPELLTTVGAIDRAYSKLGEEVRVTQIMREKWPLVPLAVQNFKTNFFRTARFEGAFRVDEVIHYQWLPPQKVPVIAEQKEPIEVTEGNNFRLLKKVLD